MLLWLFFRLQLAVDPTVTAVDSGWVVFLPLNFFVSGKDKLIDTTEPIEREKQAEFDQFNFIKIYEIPLSLGKNLSSKITGIVVPVPSNSAQKIGKSMSEAK